MMLKPSTPLPWACADCSPTMVFHDSQGVSDINQPVAHFKDGDDATFVMNALFVLEEIFGQIDALHRAFGAPGDYGYSTEKGEALFALYQSRAKASWTFPFRSKVEGAE